MNNKRAVYAPLPMWLFFVVVFVPHDLLAQDRRLFPVQSDEISGMIKEADFLSELEESDLNDTRLRFHKEILDQVEHGHLTTAEASLIGVMGTNNLGKSCNWMNLHNMAVVKSRMGQLAEAEMWAARAALTAESEYPAGDS